MLYVDEPFISKRVKAVAWDLLVHNRSFLCFCSTVRRRVLYGHLYLISETHTIYIYIHTPVTTSISVLVLTSSCIFRKGRFNVSTHNCISVVYGGSWRCVEYAGDAADLVVSSVDGLKGGIALDKRNQSLIDGVPTKDCFLYVQHIP